MTENKLCDALTAEGLEEKAPEKLAKLIKDALHERAGNGITYRELMTTMSSVGVESLGIDPTKFAQMEKLIEDGLDSLPDAINKLKNSNTLPDDSRDAMGIAANLMQDFAADTLMETTIITDADGIDPFVDNLLSITTKDQLVDSVRKDCGRGA